MCVEQMVTIVQNDDIMIKWKFWDQNLVLLDNNVNVSPRYYGYYGVK